MKPKGTRICREHGVAAHRSLRTWPISGVDVWSTQANRADDGIDIVVSNAPTATRT